MQALIGKIVIEVGKQLVKAMIAGVGLELAKVAADHVRKRLGPKKDAKPGAKAAGTANPPPATTEEQLARAKAENAELKAELEKLKAPNHGHAVEVIDDI
jgi:hypothetical protein